MKKLVYIAQHLSTGGMPQYLLKQILAFKRTYKIFVIEVNNYSNEFVVQKNKIKEESTHFCVDSNEEKLLEVLKEISPDIIHFQEIPETFLSYETCLKIFSNERKYNIITTTHSSLTKLEEILFLPDKFVLVSEWSKNKFTNYFPYIDCEVWEYPIENYIVSKEEKLNLQSGLNFHPDKFHILNVGLFTPGKNQGEIFHIAKELIHLDIQFHFVGNLAENFKSYWEPILKVKPYNCIIWGEKENVIGFYKASDLFYFSSKFELNPLAIKEALSYQLPVLTRNLETYTDQYSNKKGIEIITDNLQETKEKILNHYTKWKM